MFRCSQKSEAVERHKVVSPSPRTQITSTTQSLIFQKTTLKPPAVPTLATRFTRRYGIHALRAFQDGPYDLDSDRDGSDDSTEDSDGESCDTESTANTSLSVATTFRCKKDDYKLPPRIVLLDLPTEILEHIAASLRDPIPALEAASRYIDDRYSEFSQARFELSAFSKVCKPLRRIVERILYRDVQVDFTGWKGRKHTKWPAGSLKLLLRTLNTRPELGHFIYAAALDFQLLSDSKELERGLERFLLFAPNLKTLFLAQCPLSLWDVPPLPKTVTFATTFASGMLPRILEQFPGLQNLYLRDCHVLGFTPLDLPPHKLQTVRLDSNHEHAVSHLRRTLALCADTVHRLDIRFIGGLLQPSPTFTPRMSGLRSPSVSNLRSLRLDNISVLSHPRSGYAQVIQSLSALEELHVSNHSCFSPHAFGVLPPTLRTLSSSDFYGYWEKPRLRDLAQNKEDPFVVAVAECVTMSKRRIAHVVLAIGREPNQCYDIKPLLVACALERIGFKFVDRKEAYLEVTFDQDETVY
ncbi:hypothetical protein Hypma_008591 [Hypsizygus marmoreus]|uniref:F-box domain-containing protein n=1 Tax=Hypsizygus marmoreus TaxID=39966 RepID=A0A369JZT1_HYPMA|nr:hypothetical protein Hypma_008591 [Hypsizygus marmoreus]